MPSLLLPIFLLQLIIHLLNTVGASTINDLVSTLQFLLLTLSPLCLSLGSGLPLIWFALQLWHFYTRLPGTSVSHSVSQQRRLRSEVLRLKREMNATSSQDEFARWAKLRRQHDKAQAEYDESGTILCVFSPLRLSSPIVSGDSSPPFVF